MYQYISTTGREMRSFMEMWRQKVEKEERQIDA
jgi:hypothetical protein